MPRFRIEGTTLYYPVERRAELVHENAHDERARVEPQHHPVGLHRTPAATPPPGPRDDRGVVAAHRASLTSSTFVIARRGALKFLRTPQLVVVGLISG